MCVADAASDNEAVTVDRRRARRSATTEEVERVFYAEAETSQAAVAASGPHRPHARHQRIPTEFPRPVRPLLRRQVCVKQGRRSRGFAGLDPELTVGHIL